MGVANCVTTSELAARQKALPWGVHQCELLNWREVATRELGDWRGSVAASVRHTPACGTRASPEACAERPPQVAGLVGTGMEIVDCRSRLATRQRETVFGVAQTAPGTPGSLREQMFLDTRRRCLDTPAPAIARAIGDFCTVNPARQTQARVARNTAIESRALLRNLNMLGDDGRNALREVRSDDNLEVFPRIVPTLSANPAELQSADS